MSGLHCLRRCARRPSFHKADRAPLAVVSRVTQRNAGTCLVNRPHGSSFHAHRRHLDAAAAFADGAPHSGHGSSSVMPRSEYPHHGHNSKSARRARLSHTSRRMLIEAKAPAVSTSMARLAHVFTAARTSGESDTIPASAPVPRPISSRPPTMIARAHHTRLVSRSGLLNGRLRGNTGKLPQTRINAERSRSMDHSPIGQLHNQARQRCNCQCTLSGTGRFLRPLHRP